MVYTVLGTTQKLYKNGLLIATATSAHNQPIPIKIREFAAMGGGQFNSDGTINTDSVNGMLHGTIGYARFWQGTALAPVDIQSLYENRETSNPSIFGTVATTITDTYDSSIIATPYNGASFSTAGAEFDGVDDYVDLTPWMFGGAMTVEVYVKYDTFNRHSRIFEFAEGAMDEDVLLYNNYETAKASWGVRVNGNWKPVLASSSSFFQTDTWVHVVATVEGTNMKLYRNGIMTDSRSDGHEPTNLTRLKHLSLIHI